MSVTINTGKGHLPLIAVIAIWSVSAIVSLPGLAVSPIMGKIDTIFPNATELEVEMLESLPSLMIIPFMLLAGRWAIRGNKIKLLAIGCTVFLGSGIGCMLTRDIGSLVAIGGIMGIGAGMIIPLSTGLIVEYFTGDYRVQQLGISSAINNLTLVVATALTGWLAQSDWHLAFAVYLLPAATLLLLPALHHTPPAPEPPDSAQHRQTTINRRVIIELMLFYFAITYCSLIVTFNTPFLVERAELSSSVAGIIISLFFLAIMVPGFVLNTIVRLFGQRVNMWALMTMGIGLCVMSLDRHNVLTLILGATMTGLGYGTMQPIIYDKAATNSPPQLATLALSATMAVNYLAILTAPFIIEFIDKLFGTTNPSFGFLFNGGATLLLGTAALLGYRHSRIFGSDD